MLKDLTGKEYKVGQFVAMSSCSKASVSLGYIINVGDSRVTCVRVDDLPSRIKVWNENEYFRKKYKTPMKMLGKSSKEPTSLVIVEPPRIYILQYIKLFKQLELPMPCDWIVKDEESI